MVRFKQLTGMVCPALYVAFLTGINSFSLVTAVATLQRASNSVTTVTHSDRARVIIAVFKGDSNPAHIELAVHSFLNATSQVKRHASCATGLSPPFSVHSHYIDPS